MSIYEEAFQKVMEEARGITGVTDLDRWEYYEALKSKVYELLHDGHTEVGQVADEALSWLRQNAQINQSFNRISGRS